MSHRRSAVAAALLLAACTSPTGGGSRTATSSTPASAHSRTGTVSSPSSNAPPSPFPAVGLARTPVQTAIGDPGTADLCAAIGPEGLRRLDTATNATAAFDAVQYPPGCSVTIADESGPVLEVSVYAARHTPRAAGRRTVRTSSGLPVYGYPFDARTGSCEHDVAAAGVLLVVDSLARGTAKPSAELACGATAALADRVAEVVHGQSVPRLPVADPSVTELAACAVARHAGLADLGAFAGARVIPRGFGVNCELRTGRVFLFLNAAIGSQQPPAGTPMTVAGHRVYEATSRVGFCAYLSVQGAAGDGHHEQVAAAATTVGTSAPPAHLCEQTADALARYLTAAGLSQ